MEKLTLPKYDKELFAALYGRIGRPDITESNPGLLDAGVFPVRFTESDNSWYYHIKTEIEFADGVVAIFKKDITTDQGNAGYEETDYLTTFYNPNGDVIGSVHAHHESAMPHKTSHSKMAPEQISAIDTHLGNLELFRDVNTYIPRDGAGNENGRSDLHDTSQVAYILRRCLLNDGVLRVEPVETFDRRPLDKIKKPTEKMFEIEYSEKMANEFKEN